MNKYLLLIFLLLYHTSFAQKGITYYFKAKGAEKNNNISKAIQFLDSAINIDNSNKTYLFEKAVILYKSKQYRKTKNILFLLSTKKYYPANLYLAKIYALEKNPDSSIYFLKKYLSYHRKIPRNKIRLDSDLALISNTPQWHKLWKQKWYSSSDIKLQEAEFYLENENYIPAFEITNALINKNKKNYKAYFLKGKIFMKLQNPKNAIKNFTKAIKIYPSYYLYYNWRSEAYQQIKKYKKAINDIEKSLRLNPYQIELYPKIALLYSYTRQYDKAIFYIEKYLKFFPTDLNSSFLAAQIYFENGDYLKTIKLLNKIYDKYEPKAKLYFLRGKAYLYSNEYGLAIYDLSQALDLNPKLTEAYVYKGLCYYKQKKIDKACAQWHKAIEHKQYMANKYYYQNCEEYEKKLTH